MSDGQTQQSRNDTALEYQGGRVHLLDATNAISDSATTINSNASTQTADSDWSISHDNTAGTTTLENSKPIEFGAVSGFTVSQVVVESTETAGNYLVDNDPSDDLDLSGDGEVVIETRDISYTFG